VEGEPREMKGLPHNVEIDMRAFKSDQRLMIPHVVETLVQGVKKIEKIAIDSVRINPLLDEARFSKS
jgi:hypothetical protein